MFDPEKDYTRIVNRIIDSYPEHIKLFKFNWILRSDSTRYEIINNLVKVIDSIHSYRIRFSTSFSLDY